MKNYPGFFIKLLSLILICGTLAFYQTRALSRAAVVAENEAAIEEVEAYNREVQLEIDRRKDEEAAAKENEIACQYESGDFEGTGEGYGGPITVRITIQNDVVTDIRILSHEDEDPVYYSMAEELVDRVLQVQNTNVDVISGATFSSAGILQAVDNAMEEARRK